jgi:hypothetical protein
MAASDFVLFPLIVLVCAVLAGWLLRVSRDLEGLRRALLLRSPDDEIDRLGELLASSMRRVLALERSNEELIRRLQRVEQDGPVPAAAGTSEPVASEPVADEPGTAGEAEPVASEPGTAGEAEPVADEPVADEPVADEPVADEPGTAGEAEPVGGGQAAPIPADVADPGLQPRHRLLRVRKFVTSRSRQKRDDAGGYKGPGGGPGESSGRN